MTHVKTATQVRLPNEFSQRKICRADSSKFASMAQPLLQTKPRINFTESPARGQRPQNDAELEVLFAGGFVSIVVAVEFRSYRL